VDSGILPAPTSKVGILCSPGVEKLLQAQVGPELSSSFQQMLLACSTAYIQDKGVRICGLSEEELQQISSLAGESVLSSLEILLTSAALEKRAGSHEYLQALYLILLGTVLAVGYTQLPERALTTSDASVSTQLRHSIHLHYAHYMIYLGQKSTAIFDTLTQEHLITRAYEQWQVVSHFRWITTGLQVLPDLTPFKALNAPDYQTTLALSKNSSPEPVLSHNKSKLSAAAPVFVPANQDITSFYRSHEDIPRHFEDGNDWNTEFLDLS
jgi:hypothetical protein